MKAKDPPDVIMGEKKGGDCVRIKMNWVWGGVGREIKAHVIRSFIRFKKKGDRHLCCCGHDGCGRRGSLDGRGGGSNSIGRGVFERGNGSGLINLGWMFVNLGGRGDLLLGLGIEQSGEPAREATTEFKLERGLLVVLLLLFILSILSRLLGGSLSGGFSSLVTAEKIESTIKPKRD